MTDINQPEEYDARFVGMATGELIRILLLGAVVGLVTWGLTYVLDTYVYQALLCKGNALSCDNSSLYASVSATILAALGALFVLIRAHIYRPLLIVLAATVSLWGVVLMLSNMEWYWTAILSGLMYALAYGLYAWISRIRYLWLMLLATVVLVVVVRLVLTAS